MYALILLGGLLLLLVALFYAGVSSFVGTTVYLVVLAGFSAYFRESAQVVVLLWIVSAPVALLLYSRQVRTKYLTGAVFSLFKKMLPKMSDTERIALEAGTVWFDKDLFSGRPDFKKLIERKKAELTEEEQKFLDGPVEELCRMIDDFTINEKLKDLSPEVWAYLKKEKFFGMIIPKADEGLGFSALAHSEVVAKIATRSLACAVTVMVPNSLGPAELLMSYGTDRQKQKYLSKLATGEEIPCFALTSPMAGSDAANMPDRGRVVERIVDGKKELGMELDFDKRYITLSPVATVIALAFHLYDPDKLLGDKKDIGITVAMIPAGTEGLEVGDRFNPLNVAFLNGSVRGQKVYAPISSVIGEEAGLGQGWKMLMERLAVGRSISLPALSVAAGRSCSRKAGAYARVRKQFNLPIARFEGIEEKLAQIAGSTYAMDAVRELTVCAVDDGQRPSVISAIVKYNLTEMMRRVSADAMDIVGGAGISWGPRNTIGRAYTAAPIGITVEGANILTRSLIVFGQGAVRSHPYIFKEIKAVQEEDLSAFDESFKGHVGMTISNAVRSIVLGLTSSTIAMVPSAGPLTCYLRRISRLSACFALTTDVIALYYGSALKRKEMTSGKMADVLSELYISSAIVHRWLAEGRHIDDLSLARYGLENSLKRAQESLISVAENIPSGIVSLPLRLLLFPLGRSFKGAGDRLTHQVAVLITDKTETRERLTGKVFTPTDKEDPTGFIEQAFDAVLKAEPFEKLLAQAYKDGRLDVAPNELIEAGVQAEIITQEQALLIATAQRWVRKAIAVDEFDSHLEEKGDRAWTAAA